MTSNIISKPIDITHAQNVLDLYLSNPEYFIFCPPLPDLETVIDDISTYPDSVSEDDKHYCGYYIDNDLIGVIDLISNYPNIDILWIGLFMIHKEYQHKGIGSFIISELIKRSHTHYRSIRLAYMNDNVIARDFWLNNGFEEIEFLPDKTIMEIIP